MKRAAIILLMMVFLLVGCATQPEMENNETAINDSPNTNEQSTLSSDMFVKSCLKISDGYIIVGEIQTFAAIVKLDLNGAVVWEKQWQEKARSNFMSVAALPDGYIVVGSSSSGNYFDVSGAIIVKYDLNGNEIWYKEISDDKSNYFNAVGLVPDGYVVIGKQSDGVDFHDDSNAILIKYSFNGEIVWQKTWNDSNFSMNEFNSMEITSDNLIVYGKSENDNGGDVESRDIVIKYDLNGDIIWQKRVGVGWWSYYSYSYNSIAVDTDESIVIAALGFFSEGPAKITRLDSNGNIMWEKPWGGSSYDSFNSVAVVSDGYIVVGYMASLDVPDMEYTSKYYEQSTANDAIVVKYDKNGNMLWQKNLTDEYGIPRSVLVDGDICIIICEGDVNTVLLKLNQNGEIENQF